MHNNNQLNSNLNISPLVSNNYSFLRSLSKTRSSHKRKKLLKKATVEQLLSIAEIAINILRNRFHLTQRQKRRMLPFAQSIREISRIRSERGARRQLVQKGNGLPLALFPSLLTPIILELARSLIAPSSSSNGQ